jgi:hypothetical protein
MPLSNVTRRDALRAAATAGTGLALSFVGSAQPPAPPPAGGSETGAEFITADTQAAIDRGLSTLAAAQNEDGSFSDTNNRMLGNGSVAGISGLCGLALMAAGHQPGRGKYGRNVSRLVDYMLRLGAAGNGRGYLTAVQEFGGHQSGMYSHGFASLFLAEVCGMLPSAERQKRVRALLEQSTAFALKAQNNQGGWRYGPTPQDADVSVTVAFMMALRAARNAGVYVKKDAIRAGSAYIRACQVKGDGGFAYMRGQGSSAFARSAAAVVGLYSASVPEDEDANERAIKSGLDYLAKYTPGPRFNQREVPQQHYYYGHYYAALAMWTAGGEYWRTWFPAVRDELLARGRAGGGGWTDISGTAYATAMSLIVLQLPNNYLPILQK